MSFILKLGQSEERDRKLVMLRKKYFHNILEFNKEAEVEKKKEIQISKYESNRKFSKLNQEAFQSLEAEMEIRKIEKLSNQQILRLQYERQIQQKRQKAKRQKEMDRQYAHMQEQMSESAAERRVQDLMRIYNQSSFTVQPRRMKTQGNQILHKIENPEHRDSKRELSTNLFKNESNRPKPFFPQIQRNSQIHQILPRQPDGTLREAGLRSYSNSHKLMPATYKF